MKIKLFTKLLKPKLNFWMKPIETMDCGLEGEINHWLSENPSIEIKDIQRTPHEGIGKPEPLKHGLSGYWSRRINDEHRIVYRQQDGSILIAQLRYHYGT